MRKLSILILLAIVVNSCSIFQSNESKYEINHIGNFFWEVKSETAKVYLLGSIHLAKEDMYPLAEYIESAFEKSDSLVVEIDVNEVDPMFLLKKGVYTDGRSLKSELEPEMYSQLEKLFKDNNIPEMIYSKLKPWVAVMMIVNLELAKEGFKQELGIDMYFLNKAGYKKGIVELESMDFQVNLFDVALKDYQNEFVKLSLMDNENIVSEVDRLADMWKTGDIDGMTKMVLEEYSSQPEFDTLMELFYTKRNTNMYNKITDFFITDKTYFVVVGAAHLLGEEGIIELLKNTK